MQWGCFDLGALVLDGDAQKIKEWQPYAATMAAPYAKALLYRRPGEYRKKEALQAQKH
jgi:hypothetical protein